MHWNTEFPVELGKLNRQKIKKNTLHIIISVRQIEIALSTLYLQIPVYYGLHYNSCVTSTVRLLLRSRLGQYVDVTYARGFVCVI